MASSINQALKSKNTLLSKFLFSSLTSKPYFLTTIASPLIQEPESETLSSSLSEEQNLKEENIYIKTPKNSGDSSSASVTMPMSFMTGSIVGKRFYNAVTTREADDGNGWTVMLDYRTLKTPSKRPLKLPTLTLAKAIAAEWEYQQTDGIRPFTMPLMRLACTALERVPLTRMKIIEHMIKKIHQDLVFCRSPGDNDLSSGVLKKQMEKFDPLLDWVKSEFGFKPVVSSSFFGAKQEDGLVSAIENFLKKTSDCELAAIDAMTAAAHSLIISIATFRGRLEIEEAIELIRLEEDLQVDRWGLVEGGHDVDIADLKVQISSAAVFLGLSMRV
ncbi:ATP12 protein-like protein [Tasmannia lanceolata]|uniref:ATP12 protein-like protein n=1 Tax=Tasmannia lanceolata TaxID=3420 RepID=UPI004062E726